MRAGSKDLTRSDSCFALPLRAMQSLAHVRGSDGVHARRTTNSRHYFIERTIAGLLA